MGFDTCVPCAKMLEDPQTALRALSPAQSDVRSPYSRCPACGATSHVLHLEEWVQTKGSCSVCNAKLAMNAQHKIVLA